MKQVLNSLKEIKETILLVIAILQSDSIVDDLIEY